MTNLNYSIINPIPKEMIHNGRKYKLNLCFNRVIAFYELFKDDSLLSYSDMIDISYKWLVKSPKRVQIKEKAEVIERINKEYLVDVRNNENKKKSRTAVNFITDSKYIYAAFRQHYGINLLEQQDKLTWWEFNAMFDSLPGESKIKEIMYIRTRRVPDFNGNNLDEITRIKEQQEYYFLPENWEEIEEEANDNFERLFETIERKLENGEQEVKM